MTYLPFVDGLRAIAILAVVAFHAWPSVLPGGFVGVDVFFVISGFLITRFIAAEMADGTFSLARFYVRRARRLLPAALVCFAVIAVLSAVVLLPDAYWYYGRSLLSAVLMYANIFFYHTGGYFSAPSLEKPLLHTWSLAVEDQFYLTWPLLLLAAMPRLSRSAIAILAVVLFAASLTFAEYMIGRDPEFAFFLLPARSWELLTGATLALVADRLAMPGVASNAVAGAGVLGVLASFAMLTPESHFPGLGALPACLGTAAIIAASLNQPTVVARLLAWRPVVFVGLISYSLYLWHWPLIALASYRLERPLTAAEAAAAVMASTIIAVLSWRYVEKPFRTAHRVDHATALAPSDRRFVLWIAAGVAMVAALGLALKIEKGFPQRYDAKVRTLLDQMVASNPLRGACDGYENVFIHDSVCNFGRAKAPGESYDFALFGDSMADQWSLMAASYAGEHNLAGRQVTNSSCPMLTGLRYDGGSSAKVRECAAYQAAAERFIAANPNLKLAVITGKWERWLKGIDGASDQDTQANAAARQQRIDDTIGRTVKMFTGRGIQVVLIGQIPTYASLPVRCAVAGVATGSSIASCGMTKDAAARGLALSDAALLRAASGQPLVHVSLPSAFICPAERCMVMLNDTFLYKNASHLNRFGAQALAGFIAFPELK